MGQKMVTKELGAPGLQREGAAEGGASTIESLRQMFVQIATDEGMSVGEALEEFSSHARAGEAYARRFGTPNGWRKGLSMTGPYYEHAGRRLRVIATVNHQTGGSDRLVISISSQRSAKVAPHDAAFTERAFVPEGGRIGRRYRRSEAGLVMVTYLEGVVPCDAAPRGDA